MKTGLLSVVVFLVSVAGFAYENSGQIVFQRISNFHWQTENIVRRYSLSEDQSQCILTTESDDGLKGNPTQYEVVSLDLCNLQKIENYLKLKLGKCSFTERILSFESEGNAAIKDSGWMTDVTKVDLYSDCTISLRQEYRKMKSLAATLFLNPFALGEGPWRDFIDTEYFPSQELVESLFSVDDQKVVKEAYKLFPMSAQQIKF